MNDSRHVESTEIFQMTVMVCVVRDAEAWWMVGEGINIPRAC